MAKIKEISASEILNARGLPTIEVTVILNDGKMGIASCPSGQNVGNYEALDLKDHDEKRFEGQGVLRAINNIKTIIAPALIGKDPGHQQEIDKIMIDLDGTQNKSRLGANAILSVSMAVAKAGASSSMLPLFLYLRQFIKKDHGPLKIPIPIFDLIHGKKGDNGIFDFSEFLIVPASSKTYAECIQIGEAIHEALSQINISKNSKSSGNSEDILSPDLQNNNEGFSLIKQAINNTQVKLGFDVFFGLNSKASLFFKNEKYHIKDSPNPMSASELINFYDNLNKDIHLLYMEDPLSQEDWEGWSSLYQRLSGTSIILGSDLTATNPYRLQMATDKKAINGIVIKPNQVGTVIEALAIAEAAKEIGLKITVSHRSNETNDDFMADFAVAVSADYIKIGSLSRGENIAKYNRLMQIDNQLKIL